MIAINQKNNLNSKNVDSPDVYIDTNLRRWFSRNIGLWKSQRSYFLNEKSKNYNFCMNLKIEALENNNSWQSHYKFKWYPTEKYKFFEENPEYTERGEMQAYIQGHQLIRERFYLSEERGISNIKQVDEHEMIFESSYANWYILEHTRLLDMDKMRFRVIYSWHKDNLKIVENHHEIKLHS
tara:strand:+ start:2719 stop:3261 length:543 start_codon:yes stop_codon:yes gene_type:complete